MHATRSNLRVLTNRDRLMNADRPRVANLVVQLFDRIQLHPNKEEQLLALAGAFVLMAEVLKVSAQDAFGAVKNLMTERDGVVRPQVIEFK